MSKRWWAVGKLRVAPLAYTRSHAPAICTLLPSA